MNNSRAIETFPEQIGNINLKPLYLEALTLVERLHRLLLDVISDEFNRIPEYQVTSTQALLLFNIGDSEVGPSEMKTRGYYLGSNVSYNLRKLAEMGYLQRQPSQVDRRAARISLTERGYEIAELVNRLYERHLTSIDHVGDLGAGDFMKSCQCLRRLDRFLSDQITYRL
jgi:DNA-binding MarR family transcriptional regulator